jgi:hypothetical protein
VEENEPAPSSVPPVTVSPTTDPALPENPGEKYQYFLAGVVIGAALSSVAVMVGIFVKKRRPSKYEPDTKEKVKIML